MNAFHMKAFTMNENHSAMLSMYRNSQVQSIQRGRFNSILVNPRMLLSQFYQYVITTLKLIYQLL